MLKRSVSLSFVELKPWGTTFSSIPIPMGTGQTVTRVYLPDGNFRTVVLDPNTTAQEVCQQVLAKLVNMESLAGVSIRVDDYAVFAAWEATGGTAAAPYREQQLDANCKVLPLISKWAKKAKKRDYRLIFKSPKGAPTTFDDCPTSYGRRLSRVLTIHGTSLRDSVSGRRASVMPNSATRESVLTRSKEMLLVEDEDDVSNGKAAAPSNSEQPSPAPPSDVPAGTPSTASIQHRCLQLKVIEAKSLPAADLNGQSDPYVVAELEGAQRRTRTVYKNRHTPYWAEEFVFTGIRNPQSSPLVVTVYDEDLVGSDDVIGVVVLPLTSLFDGKPHEQWFSLFDPAVKNTLVTGEVLLEYEFTEDRPADGAVSTDADSAGVLRVTVVEARNLVSKDSNGLSDPFARVAVGTQKFKTAVARKTLSPVWNEPFEFRVASTQQAALHVAIYDWDRMSKDEFMGQVVVSLAEIDPSRKYRRWFILMPSDDGTATVSTPPIPAGSQSLMADNSTTIANSGQRRSSELTAGQHGSLRMRLKYLELPVFVHGDHYLELLELLVEDGCMGGVAIPTALAAVVDVEEREELAGTLVNIFLAKNKALPFLERLVDAEISDVQERKLPVTILFRGNSLATKAVDYFQKAVGFHYLETTIGPTVRALVAAEAKNSKPSALCETDPTRCSASAASKGIDRLLTWCEKFAREIFQSYDSCPPVLRQLYAHLMLSTRTAFGARSRSGSTGSSPQIRRNSNARKSTVEYTAVSGFLFLRFFCAAVMGPKLFHLVQEHPKSKPSRSLTLVAKVLQNLANLIEFGQKETFMVKANTFIVNNMEHMMQFIDKLTDHARPSSVNPVVSSPAIDLSLELAKVHHFVRKYREPLAELHKQKALVIKPIRSLENIVDRLDSLLGDGSP